MGFRSCRPAATWNSIRSRATLSCEVSQAIPSEWRAKCDELRSLGDVTLATYLEETGLELEDVYATTEKLGALRRAVGLRTDDAGPDEDALLRAVGRLLHVDDRERLDAYRSLVEPPAPTGSALLQ